MKNNPIILLIEDETDQSHVLQKMLEEEGCEVINTTSIESALSIIKNTFPDIIVSDIKLPGMDGLSFYEYIRTIPNLNKIPFIFVTGFNDPAMIDRFSKLYLTEYVTKPYDVMKLLEVVHKYLPKR